MTERREMIFKFELMGFEVVLMKLKFETIQVLVLRYRNSKSRMNKQVMSTLGPCVMAGYGMMKCHAGAGWRRCSALTENLDRFPLFPRRGQCRLSLG